MTDILIDVFLIVLIILGVITIPLTLSALINNIRTMYYMYFTN